ncbi:MAG: GIY-YIG nuclease family protein [Candidatus Gottesmanbacteria bacterium]|nr:GIY-YIG nuclease family protein [Candidatus Gottesmanbacteria bacterium]
MTRWFVYILLCRGGSLYTGIAKDPEKRLSEHKSGKGGAYTRSHPPVRIVYTQSVKSRSAALKREAEIKRWGRLKKIKTLGLTVL